MHGRLVRTQIDSRCLAGNPLNDPTRRDVYVYLPAKYDDTKRFPTVMLLAGFGATNHSIAAWHPWSPSTVELFDRMIADGTCEPAIMVLPDCFNRWGGSQFLDSAGTGAYQTHLAEEVIPFVDAQFRTIPAREARAVAGRSSGGFGALRLGMDRPETVSVLGSHAGDAAFEISMRPMLTHTAIAIENAGGLNAFTEGVPEGGPANAMQFDAVFTVAASAAYSPESGAFPFLRLPVDPATGLVDQAVWDEWRKQDPVNRITRSEDALKSMRLVFLDAGNRDEHGLHYAARMLHDAMRTIGVKVEHEEFDGGHRGTSWRYEASLPRMIGALAKE